MITAEDKGKFRQRKVWTEFRKEMRKLRKVDAITGSKLTKTYHLHHCQFDPEKYDDLRPEVFECLNSQSHDAVHFFFGVPGKLKPWRLLVMRLITILRKMERLNNSKNGKTL